MEQQKNKPIHVQVVTGIVKMVREFRSDRDRLVLLSDAMLVGTENVSPEAMTYIFRFARPWLDRSSSSMLDKIIDGDYFDLWAVVNAYLFRVGYPVMEPVKIEI